MRSAREKKESLFVALTTTQEGLVAPHVVAHVADLLKSWKVSAENESFLLTFEKVVRESGFLKHIAQSPFHVEKFDKAVRLFDEVKALTRRTPFFSVKEYDEFLRILEEHHKTLTAEARHVPHAVFLMTAHKAKGLEFDFVYVVHACDGRWGGRTRRDSFHLPSRAGNELVAEDDEEDERRLFYVALTRARKSVTITYATRDSEGRLRTPSRFVEEILPELKTEHDAEELGYADKRPPLFVVRETREGADRYRELVRSAFAERGISATALTNYLTCPWKWFFHDFLKTEFTQAPALLKGVAVHAALQDFFNARTKGVLTDKAFLLSRLTHHFARVDMPEEMRERMVRDMCEVLSGWYEKNNTSWAEHSVQELFVRVVLPEKEGDILLTGKLDKCECLDTRCHEVCVVDYKTGKPKSRNEILGETDTLKRKKGSGAYKRQLVFYKLLLERFQEGRYAMREGRIDFLEPTESGGYKSESFVIEEHEVRELEVEIRRVAHEIRSLAFWDTRCGEADCAECALREVMG
jgi:DNA helicase-2/ATP-dependent DNA helicase PcrA